MTFSRHFTFRAILTAFVPGAILSLLATAYYAYDQAGIVRTQYDQDFENKAELLANQSAAALSRMEQPVLRALCTQILSTPFIASVAIIGEAGRILGYAKSDRAYQDTLRFSAPIQIAKLNSAGEIEVNSAGLVVLEVDKSALQTRYEKLIKSAAEIFAALMAANVLIALFISRNLSIPFKRISETVARIAAGDLASRVDIVGDESVGHLASNINGMAEKIQNAHSNLMTQIAEATAQIRFERDQAHEITLAKSRFVAAATHDLRQPMQALKLFTSALAQREFGPAERDIVLQIQQSVATVDQLIEHFLDMSRLDLGAIPKNSSTFHCDSLFARLRSEFWPIAAQRGVEIRFRSSEVSVFTDAMLFERILRNLIANAIRYTNSSVLVSTRFCQSDKYVAFEVRDNGPGISEEDQNRIFGDYVQLSNPERNEQKGVGLGLSIVRRLAKLLDLKISVRSELGRGSVFSVLVPQSYEVTPLVLDGDSAADASNLFEGLRVAIIGDGDPDFEEKLQTLDQLECEVVRIESTHPTELSVLRKSKPEIIFMHLGEHTDTFGMAATFDAVRAQSESALIVASGEDIPSSVKNEAGERVVYVGRYLRPAKIRALLQRSLMSET